MLKHLCTVCLSTTDTDRQKFINSDFMKGCNPMHSSKHAFDYMQLTSAIDIVGDSANERVALQHIVEFPGHNRKQSFHNSFAFLLH